MYLNSCLCYCNPNTECFEDNLLYVEKAQFNKNAEPTKSFPVKSVEVCHSLCLEHPDCLVST